MKLGNEITFTPGYYMATFTNGQAALIEDPVYDEACNVMEGLKISTSETDVDGGKFYIDMTDVRMFEPITVEKLDDVKSSSHDRNLVLRIKAKLELSQVVALGREAKIVTGGPEPEASSEEEDITPPAESNDSHGVPAPTR